MNKWLSEIEIAGSNSSYGRGKCRQFVDDTRPLVDGIYKELNRNVKSRYGKVAVILWSQSRLDEIENPSFEYDTISGVCMINYVFDLDAYLDLSDQRKKRKNVYDILKDIFSNLPGEIGLEGAEVMSIVDTVYAENAL